MAFLEISNLQKDYAGNRVVENFNLAVEQGEFISFLGPSGCGKTTVLRMVAGFETPSAGSIRIDGKDVVNLKPNQRNIGMVFQAYALFPNMTVAQNLAFGLKVAGKSKAEIESTVQEMLALIKLEELGQRYPFQLSGGQQQRVALARALAVKPKLLLLDEPLSALDAKIRVSLREEIRSIQRKLQITTIFVTHDQEEALSMSDRIVVMHKGKADQLGTPFEIYNQPKTRFVASFVGTINVLEGVVTNPQTGSFKLNGTELSLGRSLSKLKMGDSIALALRPEAASLGQVARKAGQLQGIVQDVNFLGSVIRVRVKVGESVLSLDGFNQPLVAPPKAGAQVIVSFSPEELLVLAD
ncbi:ABC transporter ATP-binding protein [uncultured Thiothrix sp.]|uniref:ABC transporter ATP-binding protein n=1 Tax=uncultured Thiothrix sp. TaxID=223185 RepID=UPI0026174928|nr:ABC transporter ATP-binding protein [uncultured Thiothrix sp.]